jgi:hypothetical protein
MRARRPLLRNRALQRDAPRRLERTLSPTERTSADGSTRPGRDHLDGGVDNGPDMYVHSNESGNLVNGHAYFV